MLPQQVKSILNLSEKEEISLLTFEEVGRHKLEEEITASEHVGFTVIEDKDEKPIIVCLVTVSGIFVTPLVHGRYISFLRRQLERTDVKFYTPRGTMDACQLNEHANIKLRDQIDLPAFDLHLSLKSHKMNTGLYNDFSLTYIYQELKPKALSYQQLVSKWFNLDFNINCSIEELESIKRFPLNTMARNAITRRCCLIRPLSLKMVKEFYIDRVKMNRDIYSLALRASDDVREEYDLRGDNSYLTFCNILNQCTALD